MAECVACDRQCPPNSRWCSTACFYAEDGYPDYPTGRPDGDEDEDDED